MQFGRPAEWVGLRNYRELVTDPYLWTVVLRSIAFCLANAAVTMAVGVAVALLMRLMSRPVRILVQSGLLLAWAMPVVAALTVWQFLFDTQYGVINWLLTRLGGDTPSGLALFPTGEMFVVTREGTVLVFNGGVSNVFTTLGGSGAQVATRLGMLPSRHSRIASTVRVTAACPPAAPAFARTRTSG